MALLKWLRLACAAAAAHGTTREEGFAVPPRDVRPQEVVFAFRRYQANQLAFSTSSVTSQMNLFETGHAVYTDPRELRTKVGLPAQTPTSARFSGVARPALSAAALSRAANTSSRALSNSC